MSEGDEKEEEEEEAGVEVGIGIGDGERLLEGVVAVEEVEEEEGRESAVRKVWFSLSGMRSTAGESRG